MPSFFQEGRVTTVRNTISEWIWSSPITSQTLKTAFHLSYATDCLRNDPCASLTRGSALHKEDLLQPLRMCRTMRGGQRTVYTRTFPASVGESMSIAVLVCARPLRTSSGTRRSAAPSTLRSTPYGETVNVFTASACRRTTSVLVRPPT